MPVIGIQTDLLHRCLQTTPGRDELIEHLQHLGCDVEGYATLRRFQCERCGNITELVYTQDPPVVCERCGVDYRAEPGLLLAGGEVEVLRMELLAVRPDMFDPGGLGRALRHYLNLSRNPARYDVASPRLEVQVDPRVLGPDCPRPAIACAVVRNVQLDDDLIKVIMKLQENLHWALGRDRKHASIGVYDLDTIALDLPLRYRAVEPEELTFVPLGYRPGDPDTQLTPRRILAEHPKGVAFARLLEGWSAYPLLQDGQGRVLSLPPIINSEETRVKRSTTGLFIDVTGTDRRIVNKTLNVLVTSLPELAPEVTLEAVVVTYPNGTLVTPDLLPHWMTLDTQECSRLLGIPLDYRQTVELLVRMGHEVRPLGERMVSVGVPAYRNDILHPRDLMEDVAIAYGYHNITPVMNPSFTVGRPQPIEERSDRVRRTLTGLGLTEVLTLQLTSPELAFDALRLPRQPDHVLIDNPISVEETMLRVSLLPGLLQTLQKNTGRELPQRIFEVGDVTVLDETTETGAREVRHVAGGLIATTASFADLRAVVEALLAELGWELKTIPGDWPTFLDGRCAILQACRGEQQLEIGWLGEVHPAVLEQFHLRYPAVLFELTLNLC